MWRIVYVQCAESLAAQPMTGKLSAMALHKPCVALAVELAMHRFDRINISYFRHINFRLNVHNMGDGTREAGYRNVLLRCSYGNHSVIYAYEPVMNP